MGSRTDAGSVSAVLREWVTGVGGWRHMDSEDRFVFLDFDDTLSDAAGLHAQFVRCLGEILSDRFGGLPDRWAAAATDMLDWVASDYARRFTANPLNGYCLWLADVREGSVHRIFESMGVAVPGEAAQVGRDAQWFALQQCDALFPGAAEAVDRLRIPGRQVHIASGHESDYLEAALLGAGLAARTGRKFGADLVDCAKEGAPYYERVFAAVGACASRCVVVDDYPPAIAWAMEAGAGVIQAALPAARRFEPVPGVAHVMTDLRELPALVEAEFVRHAARR